MNVVRRIVAFSIWTLPTLRGEKTGVISRQHRRKRSRRRSRSVHQKISLTHSFLHRPFYLIFPLNFYGWRQEKKQRRWRCPRKLAPPPLSRCRSSVPRDALSPFLMDDVRGDGCRRLILRRLGGRATRNVIRGERCFFCPSPARDFFLLACFALSFLLSSAYLGSNELQVFILG